MRACFSLSLCDMAARRGRSSVPVPFESQSQPLELLLTDKSVIWTVHDHHTFMYTCPFYRVPQYGSFIEQKVCIRRDIPSRPAVHGNTTRVHVTGVSEYTDFLRYTIRTFSCKTYTKGYVYYQGTLLVAQLVEAMRYKPEGRGFDSRWCHWNFSLT